MSQPVKGSERDLSPVARTDALVQKIRDEGYVIIPSLLDGARIKALRAALSPWLDGTLLGRNDFEGFRSERVYGLLAKHTDLSLIVEHPLILGILDALLERDYLLSANLAINSHPGETAQRFHRDNAGGGGADPTALHGISTIWNLDDFNEDNGATEIIPGSHLWGHEIPAEDTPGVMKVIMPAGSVIIFTGSLFHRGGANLSDNPRLAITPQYCQPWLRQLENMPLAVPPEKARLLSDRVQSLLGYSIRTPGFMGYVNGLHPKRLIDPGYKGRKASGLPS